MTYQHKELAAGDLWCVIGELYGSEINVSISSFWDAGWTVTLGQAEPPVAKTFENWQLHHAGPWLAEQACERYPDSRFALLYRAAQGRVEILG